MSSIVIIGAGVMGSAAAVPAADNGHRVTLVGTHLDREIVAALSRDRAAHPRLGAALPDPVLPIDIEELTASTLSAADLVMVAVSSPGIHWAAGVLRDRLEAPRPIALMTKGLDEQGLTAQPRIMPAVIAEALATKGLAGVPLIGIGGPCIARELGQRRLTAVVYGGADRKALEQARALMQTAYYRVHLSDDLSGVEASAPLKNFMAIAVSAIAARHGQGDEPWSLNAASFAFTQAQTELRRLVGWLGGRDDTATGLAGMGDLHVTVGGGRNSRLGRHLGRGMTIGEACAGPMAGETVEGVDTGRAMAPGLMAAIRAGTIDADLLPLTCALIASILDDAPFTYDPAQVA
ncbi:MAG: glycerol-3-phosphate dehydrogenase [Alphaproteobacteria bacterium]